VLQLPAQGRVRLTQAGAYDARVESLFRHNESVPAGRVALSRLDGFDPAEMPWLEVALAPEWSLDDFLAAGVDSELVLISDAEGAPIGVALLRPDTPVHGEATIAFLAVQPERRYRGLGGEAGLAVERLARERLRVRRVYAGIPEGRGLAVYFWLRLGYRPLSSADAPSARLGLGAESRPGIWMVRETA
jgi:GNAT superfamily N-acetyltransferase